MGERLPVTQPAVELKEVVRSGKPAGKKNLDLREGSPGAMHPRKASSQFCGLFSAPGFRIAGFGRPFRLCSLSKGEKNVQPTILLTLALTLAAVVPARGQEPPNHQVPNPEQLLIAVQRICPVSGQPLGGHGQPVRARIAEQTAYLCCRDCLQGKVDAGHWSTVRANLARAQQKCPVMNQALPEKAQPVLVDGRLIYICCPPCHERIVADREKYFRAVDELYVAHLKAEQAGQANPAPPQPHQGRQDHDHAGHGGGGHGGGHGGSSGGCCGSHE